MTEVQQASAKPRAQESTNDKTQRLRSYLTERVKEEGVMFVKSKFITDDVNLSAKEIGSLMVRLQDEATEIDIEQWGYSSATTWRISPA